MSAFIKLSTGEYPRHAGDIALDPDSKYAHVEWVDPPDVTFPDAICYEGPPANKDGVWRMVWLTRVPDADEIERINASMTDQRRP
jgi:hypothetical protein